MDRSFEGEVRGEDRNTDFCEGGDRHDLVERQGARGGNGVRHRAEGSEAIPATAAAAGSDFVRLTFQRNLSPGPWVLSLEYKGRLDLKDTEGLFRQREGDDWYVFTQFEAIDARRAFPCFDEPRFKTPWQLTLARAEGPRSPCRTRRSRPSGRGATGSTRVLFAPTKPLPSYLVAFAVGPFDVVERAEPPAGTQVPIRMIVPQRARRRHALAPPSRRVRSSSSSSPTSASRTRTRSSTTSRSRNFDGAMENPGLVTYAVELILVEGCRRDDPASGGKYASLVRARDSRTSGSATS